MTDLPPNPNPTPEADQPQPDAALASIEGAGLTAHDIAAASDQSRAPAGDLEQGLAAFEARVAALERKAEDALAFIEAARAHFGAKLG